MNDKAKNKKSAQRMTAILLVAVFAGAMLMLGSRLPIAGNFVAGHRLKSYISAVYPGAAGEGAFAPYSVDTGHYSLSFTLPDGSVLTAECTANGEIFDEARASAYLQEQQLDTVFDGLNADGTARGSVLVSWAWNTPQQLQLGLQVEMNESEAEPFPGLPSQVQGHMADVLMNYYEALEAAAPDTAAGVRSVKASYRHYSTDEAQAQDCDGDVYALAFHLADDAKLSKALIRSADLAVTEH